MPPPNFYKHHVDSNLPSADHPSHHLNDCNDVPSTLADDPPTTPTPSSQFLSHLSNHPRTPTRKLVQPYLTYETCLRKACARGHAGIVGLAGLVPIYGHQSTFRIRAIDRLTANREKCLMPLSGDELDADCAPTIAASLEEYRRNFEVFTHEPWQV
ncbi:hypothetical protein DL764_000712 [Monosporascus ibericus]|uniref:Uncharacterized protein n=1 Tax=Monosporascus ibericus TaxID=155417 RepID=A0A4Q4TU81_9PEZI|nr:hypothetical protein DL764_000712 [Monosporascus ibericus]